MVLPEDDTWVEVHADEAKVQKYRGRGRHPLQHLNASEQSLCKVVGLDVEEFSGRRRCPSGICHMHCYLIRVGRKLGEYLLHHLGMANGKELVEELHMDGGGIVLMRAIHFQANAVLSH